MCAAHDWGLRTRACLLDAIAEITYRVFRDTLGFPDKTPARPERKTRKDWFVFGSEPPRGKIQRLSPGSPSPGISKASSHQNEVERGYLVPIPKGTAGDRSFAAPRVQHDKLVSLQ